ncbi:hypothetical protein EXN65_00145 [Clostridium botulinum]|uniref:Uncharacterized protein n=1 Tax=Clostridium botulinum TaxID=1491 RepID=A0A846HTU5_CLOBO|nr:hypothetical protein RSJ19_02620 [Clostridium botulinum]AXG92546.1 hypothetical protein AGE29_12440 [Clostridium botulinum]NEZ85695.1 hypothetical protein [Clostridium botulinum]NEZ90708.1 hypothetical protein [Clostridium botulinum]NFA99255.1 hypothetical protein [Clostridium botulinum]
MQFISKVYVIILYNIYMNEMVKKIFQNKLNFYICGVKIKSLLFLSSSFYNFIYRFIKISI